MADGKYTKADIVESLCEKTGISRKLAQSVVDSVIVEIKKALIRNSSIELRGFGTFEVRFRKGRSRARNPKTGQEVAVTSHGTAVFRPGRELRQAVWDLGESAGQAAGQETGQVYAEQGDDAARIAPDGHEAGC
jgi:integration host factor subunit beta